MNILLKPLAQITFEDIDKFCQTEEPEGIQLDYKEKIPKDLAKKIAAFANTRGGFFIIGVEEDKQTGKPVNWIGISDYGPVVEQINQIVSNVDPIPPYEVRATNEVNGNAFVLALQR